MVFLARRLTFRSRITAIWNCTAAKNIQMFILTEDGKILHCLPGFWNSRDLVYEMVFAAQLDELYKDRSLSRADKARKFRQLQMAHTKEHSNAMKRRSRMQGFDQQYEAKNRLTTTDTIRDINLVKASLQSGSHIPGHAFKTTDQILHERMASRPFIHYTRFDVAKFSDYGKPIYDKNEDQRDYRTGQTVVHNQKKDIIGNPIEPVIKLTANPKTARTMPEHIDLDVSGILRRELNLDSAGDALIDITLRTANGRLTAAEVLGHREFVLTKLYRSA